MTTTWTTAASPPPINDEDADGNPASREVIGVTSYGYAATVRYMIDVEQGDEEPSWVMHREDVACPEHLEVAEWIDLPDSPAMHD